MTTELDVPSTTPPSSEPKRRPGLWRVVSLLCVAAAILLCTIAVLQARSTSNVGAATGIEIELESATVRIADGVLLDAREVAVLGLDDATSRRRLDDGETAIDVPVGLPSVIGAYADDGSLVGLSLRQPGARGAVITIDATTTARALLVLSPAILRPDLASSLANVALVERDDAFDTLVDAIEANSTLSVPNDAVELAYAQIIDRVPIKASPPDQGCDSVLDPRAYAVVGACIEPAASSVLMTNEQDRWVLLYGGEPGTWNDLCGIVAPSKLTGDAVAVSTDRCGTGVIAVAPGPMPNQGPDQSILSRRVQSASAVHLIHAFVGPFADLAAASAGFNATSTDYLTSNVDAIVDAVDPLIETSAEFSSALDVMKIASTPVERHASTIAATRLLVASSDTTSLLPQRIAGNGHHLTLLDFYERAGSRMVASRTEWRWTVDGVGTIVIGAPS